MNIGSHGKGCGHACCLRIQKLTVKFGSDTVLDNIDLHAHCGEIIAIIGPNGAGKSTLLKTILGQQDYTGTIAFSIPGQRNRKPAIGYVPQSPKFDPGDPLTVADLFACCMSNRPVFLGRSKLMKEKIPECLSRVNALDLINKRVGTLSGGELQRVLLALALEPIMQMLDELRQTYDLSILMTTHDFSSLETYMDQVILMEHRILAQGTPSEVLNSDAFLNTFHRKGGAK